jgi:hypothetical protein
MEKILAERVELSHQLGEPARVLAGTYAAAGPRFLAAGTTERIDTRDDEHYRQRVMAGEGTAARPGPDATGGEG